MKTKSKAKILAFLTASTLLLSGCVEEKKEVVEIDGVKYIKNEDEYTKIDLYNRVFEPGTHILHYVNIPSAKTSSVYDYYIDQGYNNGSFFIDEAPEGYRLVGVTSYSNNDGYDEFIIYIFVNEKTVIVNGRYDDKINEIVYDSPGVIKEESSLTLEP